RCTTRTVRRARARPLSHWIWQPGFAVTSVRAPERSRSASLRASTARLAAGRRGGVDPARAAAGLAVRELDARDPGQRVQAPARLGAHLLGVTEVARVVPGDRSGHRGRSEGRGAG